MLNFVGVILLLFAAVNLDAMLWYLAVGEALQPVAMAALLIFNALMGVVGFGLAMRAEQ
jgi:hypothetical protein